jgi:hypothetical protein
LLFSDARIKERRQNAKGSTLIANHFAFANFSSLAAIMLLHTLLNG